MLQNHDNIIARPNTEADNLVPSSSFAEQYDICANLEGVARASRLSHLPPSRRLAVQFSGTGWISLRRHPGDAANFHDGVLRYRRGAVLLQLLRLLSLHFGLLRPDSWPKTTRSWTPRMRRVPSSSPSCFSFWTSWASRPKTGAGRRGSGLLLLTLLCLGLAQVDSELTLSGTSSSGPEESAALRFWPVSLRFWAIFASSSCKRPHPRLHGLALLAFDVLRPGLQVVEHGQVRDESH